MEEEFKKELEKNGYCSRRKYDKNGNWIGGIFTYLIPDIESCLEEDEDDNPQEKA